MSYVIYGDKGSGSASVEAALAEIGATYRVEDVDLGAEEQRGDRYAAINPQRKLPTLITPAGETLTESAAILLTLAERHPEAGLLPPAGSPERAQAVRWLVFLAAELYPIVEIIDYPARFAGSPDTGPAVRERAREIWRRRWLVVESAIAGDPWLLPSGFCVTDIYISVLSRWAGQTDWRPAHIPKVEAITAAVAARPGAGPVWRRHFTND